MDSAYCTANEKLYDAVEFASLPPHLFDSYRRALICHSCQMEAFFRRASTSGRGPCFGARPHAPGCEQATVDSGIWGIGGDGGDEPIINAAGRIVIDVPNEQGADVEPPVGGAQARRSGVGCNFGGDGGVSTNATRRRLRSLLRRLVSDPEFRNSNIPVTPPDGAEPAEAREFFVSFEEAESQAIGRFRGLWGMITDAAMDHDGTLWLNSGNRSDISLAISAEDIDQFISRWRIDDIEELSGAQVLVLAVATRSQRGKTYAPIRDIRYVAVDLA